MALTDDIRTDLADLILQVGARVIGPERSCLIHTHKAYLYSIFYNLVSNALKFRSESPPLISITVATDLYQIQISIIDNGQGIDLNRYEDQLFKPYKRFHGGKDGKGLGLFLVKSHVESLGGSISVVSSPGMGTHFTISLPIRDQD